MSIAKSIGIIAFAFAVLVGLSIGSIAAKDHNLAKPEGKVELRVIGNIAEANVGNSAAFDRSMLERLPQHEITTTTKWTEGEGKIRFSGPLMKDVLAAVGARGGNVRASALDDYTVTIPVSDFSDFPVILAINVNGQPIPDDKAPGWIMYPWDANAGLKVEKYFSRAIWQVVKINVQ